MFKYLKTKPCLGLLPCEPPTSQLHARTELMIHFPMSPRSSFICRFLIPLLPPVYNLSFYTIFPLISASRILISYIIGIKLLPYFSVLLLLCLCGSEFETYCLCRSILPSFSSHIHIHTTLLYCNTAEAKVYLGSH